MKPTEDLMNDHAAISIMLDIMQEMAGRINREEHIDTGHVEKVIDFLKNFADKCHHGKEEAVLFPALVEAGLPAQNGPVGMMLYEHSQGREYIGRMIEALGKMEKNDREVSRELSEAMLQYAQLLRSHIMKENSVLFPMADDMLNPAQQEEIFEKFEEIEEKLNDHQSHQEYHNLIKQLQAIYLK